MLSADEIDTELADDQALVYIKGQGWFVDQKNDPRKHPNFKYTAGEKEGHPFDWSGKELAGCRMQPLRKTSDLSKEPDLTIDLDKLDLKGLQNALRIEM